MKNKKGESLTIKQNESRKNSLAFTILCMCFTAILIVSNIAASNTMDVTSFISLSSAELLFPISYIINDLIVEIYGIDKTKKVIFLGLIICFCSLVFLHFTTLLPTGYSEYQVVFGFSPGSIVGITLASIAAFVVGSLLNAYIMHWLKNKHKERKFFFRAIISSVAGEFFDSFVFIFFCCIFATQFYSWERLLPFVLTISVIKIVVEILLFPITKWLLKTIKKQENLK